MTGATATPSLEAVAMFHGVEGEGAAPAPSPEADAFRVELWVELEDLIECGELIVELDGAEVAVRDLFEIAATAAHAAIVDVEDGEAMLGEELVEELRGPTPCVGDGLLVRAAVGVDDERDAFRSYARCWPRGRVRWA